MPESKTPMGRVSTSAESRQHRGQTRRFRMVMSLHLRASVVKVWLAALATALVLVAGEATGSTAAKQDVSIPMDDGVSIAATLYLPDGTAPAGGWPALVFLHGLSGNRQSMNALVEGYGFAGQSYAILTFDARGHGESGGLVGDRRPARGRRHSRRTRLARRPAGRLRHEDRRVGNLLRRRRRLQLARRRRAMGGGRRPSRRGPTSTPRSCRRGS